MACIINFDAIITGCVASQPMRLYASGVQARGCVGLCWAVQERPTVHRQETPSTSGFGAFFNLRRETSR
jgi:hypothetical protein